MNRIVVLTGAGISAESGLKTFRDSNGLWEGHDVMEVASPEGWASNPKQVLDFYNARRRQLKEVSPNEAHLALAKLEKSFKVDIVTQNVDDLHERAGSSSILHLHGELLKVRSSLTEEDIHHWTEDLNQGDVASDGSQLRPHIVWFGEQVPLLDTAVQLVSQADHLIIVGTSMQVYPAASLIHYVSEDAHTYFVDPFPAIKASEKLTIYPEKASIGVPKLVASLLNLD